jgi:hypothetical protein
MKGIYIGLPIWGAKYIEQWNKYALPALLAPGNLEHINRCSPTTLWIYTSIQDAERIKAVSFYKQLCEVLEGRVKFVLIGVDAAELVERLHPFHHHGGTCFKNCQNMCIAQAWKDDCGYMCTAADVTWSNRTGWGVETALSLGKRAWMYAGYGADGRLIPWFEANRRSDGIIDISPLEFSKALLDASDGARLPNSIEMSDFGASPGNLRWVVKDRGFLVRPHHVNIGWIYPEKGPVFCNHGTDHEMAQLALSNWDQVYATYDTTEYLGCAINDLGNSGPEIEGKVYPQYSREHVALYLKVATSEWHRHWMQQHWWAHDGSLPPGTPERVEVEAASDIEIAAIMEVYSRVTAFGGMTPELSRAEWSIRHWDYPMKSK